MIIFYPLIHSIPKQTTTLLTINMQQIRSLIS